MEPPFFLPDPPHAHSIITRNAHGAEEGEGLLGTRLGRCIVHKALPIAVC